jgi:hypothetical protein
MSVTWTDSNNLPMRAQLEFSYLVLFLSINITATTATPIAAITMAYSASWGKSPGGSVSSSDGVDEAEGVGVSEGVEVGVGVGDGDVYVVIPDHPLCPWTLHKARARTEYELALELNSYSTVKVIELWGVWWDPLLPRWFRAEHLRHNERNQSRWGFVGYYNIHPYCWPNLTEINALNAWNKGLNR